MAIPRRDTSLSEIGVICANEENAIEFAELMHLLPVGGAQNDPNVTQCWHPGAGTPYAATVTNGATVLPVFRCRRCKRRVSRRGGNSSVGGPARGTWFSRTDAVGRPESRVKIGTVLLITWCWAKRFSREETIEMLNDRIGSNGKVLTDWWNYIREVCQHARENAPPMGGPGYRVQIDESFVRGRRKNNQGRLLPGNRVAPARRNYGRNIVGPWVYGMTWVRPDNRRELRSFSVLRRNTRTLRPITQHNVAPGTTVVSDEWRAYNTIPQWVNPPYIHKTANHSQNFVNPVTGAHTQLIERQWKGVKTHLVRLRNCRFAGGNIQLHLDEAWWQSVHSVTNRSGSPFPDILDEIARQYPLA